MSKTPSNRESFIHRAKALVLEQIALENFGVSELAEAMNMSRSSLLRKIKKRTGLSASQFIREVRLEKSMEMLRETSLNVSEVSYQVGFGSTSYFIKCFRERYGYPPGEAAAKFQEAAGLQEATKLQEAFPGETEHPEEPEIPATAGAAAASSGTPPPHSPNPAQGRPISRRTMGLAALGLGILVLLVYFLSRPPTSIEIEKSIAVLPFKNESSDTANTYFVNGLMESTLKNLQKIEDLRVISRPSVEKYRHSEKTIQEMAGELGVNYFIAGSGQRAGERVLLNIQLIEAATDRQIWAEQYSRELGDIFALQHEVAQKIASSIEAIVTPAEREQIEKVPTDNLAAYDYYLQALEPYHAGTAEGLSRAIGLFDQAIGEDPQFALAYANMAISYFLLDMDLAEKKYTDRINNLADKALLYDSKLAESLVAKALYYLQVKEFRLALPHLEKALEYNPNSVLVYQLLSDYYARIVPDTGKYLEYALKGNQLDYGAGDSITRSYSNLHLGNAFIQTGFPEQAMEYIDQSIAYYPQNEYAPLLKIYIQYALDRDIQNMQQSLVDEWKKDTTRLDILQEVGKAFYFQEAYDSAYYYYEKFVDARNRSGLEIYPQEDLKIGRVYEAKGRSELAKHFYQSYASYCQRDRSIYRPASLAVQYAHEGKIDAAIEQFEEFAQQDNFQYWMVLFMDMDAALDPLKSHPGYAAVMQKISDRFWANHEQLREELESDGLL